MMTQADYDSLLGHADAEIARWLEAAMPTAGRGMKITDGVVSVQPEYLPRGRAGEEVQTVAARFASALFLELVNGVLTVNLPPIYGAVPELLGTPIYDNPRPAFASYDNQAYYAVITYTRTPVTLNPTEEEDPTATVGLLVTDVVVTIEQREIDDPPESFSPAGGEGEIEPYPGDYQTFFYLGKVEGGVLIPTVAPLPNATAWGGTTLATVPEYGDTQWTFSEGETYP